MTIVYLKGREAPKAKQSAMETLIFKRDEILAWQLPRFQRPLRINNRVLSVAEEIKREGGVIPGVLTLGRIGPDKRFYIVDGQHRVEAFKITELQECIADVRTVVFANMSEMAEEYVNLNARLVNMRPDDILRGLEESTPLLRRIRENCEFVAYTQIRRKSHDSPLIGMSQLLRAWHMSAPEVPAQNAPAATVLAMALEEDSVTNLIAFLQTARSAWGADQENYRLWSTLNITLTMWMWRRLVLDRARGTKRAVVLSPDEFRKCLLSVSADNGYVEWLAGRTFTERDRSPAYVRLKNIFTRRLQQETTKKILMPQPSWTSR